MTERLTRGWKVIRRSERTSSIIHKASSEVIYPKLRVARPKKHCGPLAVFCELKYAKDFMDQNNINPVSKIVPCNYKPSSLVYMKMPFRKPRHISKAPEGTRLADFVTCLE